MSTPWMEENVKEGVRALMSDGHLLKPEAHSALMAINAKIDTQGVQAITPVESVWLSTLMAEASQRAFMRRLAMAAGAF